MAMQSASFTAADRPMATAFGYAVVADVPMTTASTAVAREVLAELPMTIDPWAVVLVEVFPIDMTPESNAIGREVLFFPPVSAMGYVSSEMVMPRMLAR
jgi:hypothetical protein